MDDIDRRLMTDAAIRPGIARDILDESATSFDTLLIISQVVRVAGELPCDKSKAFRDEIVAAINKAEGRVKS